MFEFKFQALASAAASAALLTLASGAASAAGDNPLTVQYTNCTEFVGLGPVDAVAARALVPARYNVVVNAQGATLVVRVADCSGVKVGPLPARAGRVAQIGILISSPDGTATDPNTSINNYTLTYASNVPALVLGLATQGVPATLDVGLAYEFSAPAGSAGASELYAAVAPELAAGPTWFLHGSVNTPTIPIPFLANWWRSAGSRQVKMSSVFPDIKFDFSGDVSFTTSRQNLIGKLLPGNQIAGFPVSFRGAYSAATMVVTASSP